MIAKLLAVLPPPPRLDRRAIAVALENVAARSRENETRWEHTAELLSQVWPDWERITRGALDVPADPPLSPESQAGLVWLVCHGAAALVPDDLFTSGIASESVVSKWIALTTKIQADELNWQAVKALSDVIEARQSDPRWDYVSRSWPRLTDRQKAVVSDLVKLLVEEKD